MIACAIAVLRSFIYMSMHGIARESLVCTHTKFFVLKTYDFVLSCKRGQKLYVVWPFYTGPVISLDHWVLNKRT